jgi:hypothetical protein
MVMVIEGLTALGAVPLDAVTMKVNGPAVVGVPDRTPVVILRVRPPGSVPLDTEKVGAGLPLAVKV